MRCDAQPASRTLLVAQAELYANSELRGSARLYPVCYFGAFALLSSPPGRFENVYIGRAYAWLQISSAAIILTIPITHWPSSSASIATIELYS